MLDELPSKVETEKAIVSQANIGTVSQVTLGKLLRVSDGVERILWAFPRA